MHEAELTMGVLAPELGIALHCCAAVNAMIDHRDPIVDAMVVLGVCIERFDHEPLIGMCITHLRPAHASTVVAAADIEQLLATAAGVLDGSIDGSIQKITIGTDPKSCKSLSNL
jgi:hypothetical protein